MATNIAALFGNEGVHIFQEISSWDPNYDSSSVALCYKGALESVENYGPVTWAHISPPKELSLPPDSSLAGGVVSRINSQRDKDSGAKPGSVEYVSNLLVKKINKQGVEEPRKILRNIHLILERDARFAKKIWRNHLGQRDCYDKNVITDEWVTSVRDTMETEYGLYNIGKDDTWDVIKLIASQNEVHPVKEYLRSLTWDGVDRIPELAVALGQPTGDSFIITILRKFLISAVVRPWGWDIPSQNMKVDTVLILKGSQGKRKSSFFKALCKDPQWFSDSLPSIERERKDASIHVCGKWLKSNLSSRST